MGGIDFSKGQSYDGTIIDGGFIYANGPENICNNLINTDAKGKCYVAIPLQSGKTYEAEFYKWNYSSKTIRIGIGIKNDSTTQQGSVTILKSAIMSGYVNESNPSQYIGADMCLSFMQSSLSTNVTIPVGTSGNPTQGFKALISQAVSGCKVINGRVRFRVNSGNLLKCKIFFVEDGSDWEKRAGLTSLISINDLNLYDEAFKVPKTYYEQGGSTGLYKYIQRYGPIGTEPQIFALGNGAGKVVTDKYNTDEFEEPEYTLPFERKGNMANWGIVYTFCGTNPNAKKVKLTPLGKKLPAVYVVKENGIWKKVTATQLSPATLTLTGGTTFWFILPGGNGGEVKIQYVE
jgi:hypothetical protein